MSDKLPFQVVERRAKPFIESVIPVNVERLHKHRENLQTYHAEKDWESLHKEQVLAHGTLQQLKSNVEYLEQCRGQIQPEEVFMFDLLMEPVKKKVLQVTDDFGGQSEALTLDSETSEEFQSLSLDDQVALVPSNAEETIQSWEKLRNDLRELQELTTEFGRIVASQQDRIDGVSANIEQAEQLIQEGGGELRKAAYLKSAMLPVAGALIGGVVGLAVGGPVGLIAGSKLAFVGITAGGMVAGAGAGVAAKEIKKHNDLQQDKKEN